MSKSNHTKRALLASVLSMALCLTMLVGSTFAWFTDTVTSGRNQILAGNLDVELFHTNAVDTDEEVGADTMLFLDAQGNPVQWEPGVIVYENFTVKNVGSLALKYQLTLNAQYNTVNGVSLADVLRVAVLKEAFDGDRAAAQAQDFSMTVAEFVKKGSIAASGALKAGATDAPKAVIIYWQPSDKDNDYNFNNGKEGELSIDLGVTLAASQDTVESDSFGPDYDADAASAQSMNAISLIAQGYEAVNSLEDLNNVTSTKIFLNQDITTTAAWNITSAKLTEIDLNGHSLSDKVVVKSGADVTITDSLGGGSISKIDVQKGTATLDNCALTGTMNVCGGAELIIKGGKCTASLDTEYRDSAAPKKITIEDGEFSGNGSTMFFTGSNSDITINGGKLSGKSSYWNIFGGSCNVTINGGTFENLGLIGPGTDSTFTIEDGTFVNLGTFTLRRGSELTITGGTFTGKLGFQVQNQSEASSITVIINGGDYSQATLSSNFGDNQSVIVYNGLFNFDPSTVTGFALGDGNSNTYASENGDGTWSVATVDEDDFEDPFG